MGVRENIAKNIILLRKSRNWKQSDLAAKLHFTDKAISKWERGESTPDVESLAEIAKIFDVSIDFLFQENEEVPELQDKHSVFVRMLSSFFLLSTAIFLIATVMFVYTYITNRPYKDKFWIAFIWATFISLIVAYFLLRRAKYKNTYPYILSAIVWGALTTGYLQALVLGENVWMIFLVGVPLQIGVILNKLIHK